MAFDPDAYLKSTEPKTSTFDPDAYLASKPQAQSQQAGIGFGDFLSDVGTAIQQTPTALMGAAAQAYQGNSPEAIIEQDSLANKLIEDARKSAKAAAQEKGGEDKYMDFLGFKIKRSDVRNMPQNLSMSAVTMGTGLLSGIVAGAAVTPETFGIASVPVGTAATMATAGKMAYNIDTNNFLRDFRDGLNEESMRQRGIPISNAEFLAITQSPDLQASAKQYGLALKGSGAVEDLAREHGLHEAGWEAIGSTIGIGAGKYIFRQALEGKIIKPILAGAGELGTELAGETATQIGQTNVERKAGISEEKERSFLDPESWKKSFEEVAGPTLISTGVMTGAPHIAGAATRMVQGQTPQAVAPQAPIVAPQATPTPAAPAPATVVPASAAQDTAAMMAEIEDIVQPKPTAPAMPVEPQVQQVAPTTSEILDNAFMWRKDGVDTPIQVVAERPNKREIVALVNGEETNIPINEVVRNEEFLTKQAPAAPVVPAAPAIETELKDLYKERNKLSKVGDNLIPWLKKYGIKPSEKADMGIEGKKFPVGIFKAKGYGLDELARAAVNDGIITEADLTQGVGGVESFRDLIYDALQGNVSRTPVNMENMAKLDAIQSRIEQLENSEYQAEPTAEEDFKKQKQLLAKIEKARKAERRAEDLSANSKEKIALRKAEAEYEAFEAEARPRADKRIAKLTGQAVTDENIQAEMDRKAEEARKAAPPPTGELDEDIPFAKATVPTEEQRAANETAANVLRNDGRETSIIYQDGDVALAKTRRKNGDVIYVPFRNGRYPTIPADISTDAGKGHMRSLGLTAAQQQEFMDIRNKLEKAEEEKHAKEPFLKIKPGVTGSAGVPQNIVNIARNWTKMLGIKGNVHIMTAKEAFENKDKFTGPHRPIGYMGTKVEFGAVRQLADGTEAIVLTPSTSISRTLETLAHEIGHIHERQVFDNADQSTKRQIIAAYNVWYNSQKGKSVKELVDSLRPKTTAQQTILQDPMAAADRIDGSYWKSFSEWYADQVSRWAVSSAKPLTVVDKFFKKLADALKKFYQTAKGSKFLPSVTMKEFLDGIARQAQMNDIVDRSNKGQMALFAKSIIEDQYVTVDEIIKMQRDAYNELSQTEEFKKAKRRIIDAREEFYNRFDAVKNETIRMLKDNPEFKRAAEVITDESTISQLAMDLFRKQAEEKVPQPKLSEHDATVELNNLIDDFYKRKGIPEPRQFSDQANQYRDYYTKPEFRKWFGDSKAVNKDGQPLVAFHTTANDFNVFDVGRKVKGQNPNPNYSGKLGSWFTAPSLYSGEYEAGNAENAVSFVEGKEGENTMLVHLSIKNPIEYHGFEELQYDRDTYPSIVAFKKALIDQGYDGIVIRNSMTDGNVDRDDWVAFYPSQVKSAMGNTGEFNPEKEDITFAKSKVETAPAKGPRNIEGQVVSPVWNSPEVTKTDNLLYKLQDKHIDTKRVIQAIEKEAGKLEDQWNVYQKEELYHGRTSAALRKFLLQDLMPVIKQMSKMGISPADMKAYLHNRHATERNNQIARIRPDTLPDGSPNPAAMTDGGSGLTYKQIDEYFANLDPNKAQKLEKIAKEFDKMVQGTQNILVNSGIEDQATIDAWNKTYKHYVPLFREDDDFASHPSQGTGKGYSVSGDTSKRAMGSTKGVQDILGNILAQRERALIKAEKVRVGRALYGLSIKNPNPEFWLPVNPDAIKDFDALAAELDSMGLNGSDVVGMMQEVKKPEIVTDRSTGLQTVRYRVNPLERYKDNVFPVRVNGKDRYIFFNQNDPRAKRMVEAMKNLDTEQLGAILGMFGKFTRWFSAVNTQYNPVFGGINLLRDVQGAAINLSTTKIAGEQAKVLGGVMPAMRTIFRTLRAEQAGKQIPDTPMSRLWEEFKESGGQTLYRDSLTRKAEEKQLIDHELERLKRGPVRKAFSGAVQLLSDFNDTIENAVRLSAYKVAVEKGLSREQAASIAKNLTVNFDRKGQLGSRINALYAFFNAAVQGSARLYETLKGPAGRKIIAGGITLGAMQAVALALAGFDEDEPPEFIKERNLIIPLGDKKYAMIPMPLGLHFFPNIGRITAEWAINDFKNPGKHVANLFGVGMDAFNPLGSSGLSMQTLAPTIADPFLALDANKDAFGRPIYKEDRATNPSPGYLRSREGATAISKLLAEFMNYASGGTKYQKGTLFGPFSSPTGDEIDYLVGQFTGGVGRELMKVQQAVESSFTGEDLPPYRVPIAGRFVGDAESKAADAQRFYENVTRMADFENEIKGRAKNREDVAGFMRENPQARLWQVANTAENQISQLNKTRKELLERGAPKERIQRIEEQKQKIMRRFNDQVKALEP